jgi:large subunit ribosomal protein L17
MMSNLATSLILHKRVFTTVAKARELRVYLEPLITKAKTDSTHNRRTVFSYLQDKEAIKELFGPVAVKVAERPGGYLRIIKTGNRLGDNADTCMVEMVDFNEIYSGDTTVKKTTRRSRRGAGTKKAEGATDVALDETVATEVASTDSKEEAI